MITCYSPISDKIAKFRSLFLGREDVYPRRFENRKTKKSGYSPVCGNEWVRGVCGKPKIKCFSCTSRQFLPITDEVIKWHLSGVDSSNGIRLRKEVIRLRGWTTNLAKWLN